MLRAEKPILVTKDMFNVNNKILSHITGQPFVPCQYGGSAEHWLNTCSQVAICPTWTNKNHNPLYTHPLLKNSAKSQEKKCKGHQLGNLKMSIVYCSGPDINNNKCDAVPLDIILWI